ncbi:hypothetical protein JTE90_015837 [Oedothorax gibbosus]|uniref:SEC14-like protein 2 n=1 Tax=Oedothorax gibbosus TaxID=931172 RepID=A0AAV6VVQ1_9ARAC|nr:hypothetical protein JTE90_015837 [Oedothorax gibbosus]
MSGASSSNEEWPDIKMSGTVGNLNPNQETALHRLKELTSDRHKHNYDDYYYLRWLRARDFDVSKAVSMMQKNISFRKKIGADTILTDYKPPELIEKFYPRGYLGPDKEGCPVRFMPFKNLDLRGFVYSVKKSDVLKFLTFLFEQDIKEMEEMSKKLGRVIEKHSYIIDMDGYSFRQASNRDALKMFNEVLKLYEAHYPERMKICYFINAPIYFNFILNLSKPFLSDATINKFRIFGKSRMDEFSRTILNDMDAELVPKFLGGNRTDPDGNELCHSCINYGSMIPTECYNLKKSIQSLEEQEGVTSLKVSRSSFRLIEIEVPVANSKVEWFFETAEKDIAVGFYYRSQMEEDEELIPPERVSSHLVPESGAFVCEKAGIYALKFDNTYSWLSTKRVFYKIKVIKPEEEDEASIQDID